MRILKSTLYEVFYPPKIALMSGKWVLLDILEGSSVSSTSLDILFIHMTKINVIAQETFKFGAHLLVNRHNWYEKIYLGLAMKESMAIKKLKKLGMYWMFYE